MLGLNLFDLYPPEQAADVRRGLAGEEVVGNTDAYDRSWRTWVLPMRDAAGSVIAVAGVSLDITESTYTEKELRTKLALVETQQQVIRDLSTPIIEVWENILTLPMVGVVDTGRTAEIVEDLLTQIVRKRARFAILDLTGVEVVDTSVASHLLNLVRTVRLLGAEGLITGIRPTVAQTMGALDADLASVVTRSTLREGIRYCIARAHEH